MVIGILLFLIIIIILRYSFKKLTEPFFSGAASGEFPRIIWTYWDTPDLPLSVKYCIHTWKKHNPNYEIRILNKLNLGEYLDEDLTRYEKFTDMIQRFADLVRISILEKYGGIWSDATIFCNKPYTWIEEGFRNSDTEYIGYYIDSMTKPEFKDHAKVVENWFFAARPGSSFLRDWRAEFLRFNDFPSAKEYIHDIEKTTDLQNINGKEYLAMHCAAQKVLQNNPNGYRLQLRKAEDGPFKYLTDVNWDSHKAVNRLLETKEYFSLPIIKLRGGERGVLEEILKKL